MTQSPEAARRPTADEPIGSEEESAGADHTEAAGERWKVLVSRIQEGEEAAQEELYEIFARGIRFYLCRQLGPNDLEDRVHDTFLIVIQAIRRGDLREPERLMGFIRTVVRRQISSYIEQAVSRRREQGEMDSTFSMVDRESSPEQRAIDQQKRELMAGILNRLGSRDREILTRFYLHEQTQEEICEEMALTETQFRLLKSRAKAKFGEIGRKKLTRPFTGIFLRSSASAAH
jgi:RNA polymerase sigma-70 factor, ECF subfamily